MDSPSLESKTDFHQFLTSQGLVDQVYKAMEHDDISEVVMTALDLLIKTRKMPQFPKEPKSVVASNLLRSIGNNAYTKNHHQLALESYNKALACAWTNSPEMKLAYSNRSALLLKMNRYKACLIDIQICEKMGELDVIAKKIAKRKKECEKSLWNDNLEAMAYKGIGNFFNFDVERHLEVPCASKDIDIIMEDGLPKIVAAKNIKIGTVVALETPFVSQLDKNRHYTSCYFCHKLSLNLIPCDSCVFVMFCSEKCMVQCKKEYHSIECQIMEVLDTVLPHPAQRMAFKAALKMKYMCRSWDILIKASSIIGNDRIKNSSINEIFDGNNAFSLLNFVDNSTLIHGTLYNFAFVCAMLIHSLDCISFFPKSPDEKIAAMRAMARILVSLVLFFPTKLIQRQVAENISTVQIGCTRHPSSYWLAFTNRLKHACDANIMPLALHNKIALVALRPIPKGAELNISYIDHWHEMSSDSKQARIWKLYMVTRQICHCIVCREEWTSGNVTRPQLTKFQRKTFSNWFIKREKEHFPHNIHSSFKTTCETLAVFDNDGNSNERYQIYNQFRSILAIYQYVTTNNIELGNKE